MVLFFRCNILKSQALNFHSYTMVPNTVSVITSHLLHFLTYLHLWCKGINYTVSQSCYSFPQVQTSISSHRDGISQCWQPGVNLFHNTIACTPWYPDSNWPSKHTASNSCWGRGLYWCSFCLRLKSACMIKNGCVWSQSDQTRWGQWRFDSMKPQHLQSQTYQMGNMSQNRMHCLACSGWTMQTSSGAVRWLGYKLDPKVWKSHSQYKIFFCVNSTSLS